MSICICTTCSRNCVPSPVKQGEKTEWTWTVCDYPADEYDLQIRFRGPSTGFNVSAVADGTAYDLTHTFGASITVGKWLWQAWITEIADPTNTFEVQSGYITVETGFTAVGTGIVETRSPAKIQLDAIDTALLAFSTSDVVEYEIQTPAGSRRVKRSDKASLMANRKYWAAIVSMERTRDRVRNGGKLMRSIGINVTENSGSC